MRSPALLHACADLIGQVLTFEHPADAVLARYVREHRQWGPRERQALGDAVFHLLRQKARLEHLSAQATQVWAAAEATPMPGLPTRLALLTLAETGASTDSWTPAQRLWVQTVQALDPASGPEETRTHLPAWLSLALKEEVGNQFEALCEALNRPAPLDLRVNTLRLKRPEALARLVESGVDVSPTPLSPWGLRVAGKPRVQAWPLFEEGALEVQDEGSQLLALLTDARRQELVADFCAGAGGKTLALGAAMRNTGRLYAFDTSAHRLEALRPRLERSGLSNVHTMVVSHEADPRLQRMAGKLDRVLVDAPCSGLGTLRRSPDLKWRLQAADIPGLAQRQLAILSAAARLLKPGGVLIYATCSLLRAENESVAEAFGQAHTRFEAVDAATVLARAGVPGAQDLCRAGFLRLWPHLHQTDGFFAAIWRQKP